MEEKSEQNKTTEQQEKEDVQKKIVQLKCDIFDIIRQQEILNNKINQLQNLKLKKAEEFQKLELQQQSYTIK